MAIFADDIQLVVSCEQFGCSIEGSDFATFVYGEDTDMQIAQQCPQLLIKDQFVFYGSFSGHV
jgi:hypothetical protein